MDVMQGGHGKPWSVLLLVLALVGCNASKEGGAAAHGGGAAAAIPVVTARAQLRDMPLVLEGLGNVAAFYTVTLRSQVDGRVDRVLFEEGQDVRRGQLLLQIDPRGFDIQRRLAGAALARDKATLKGNTLKLTRLAELRRQNMIAQQDLDDQQSLVDSLLATVEADDATLANANLQLDYAGVVAPISGRAGLRLVDPGTLVHPNDANGLVVLTQLDPIAVLLSLPEDDLPQIAKHMRLGPLKLEAYSRDGSQLLGTGTVTVIDNQINASTGTVRLKGVLANPNLTLWPNQFVKARLTLQVQKDALVIPVDAVQYDGKQPFTFVAKADQKAHMQPLKITRVQSPWAIVGEGLVPGDDVVVEGHQHLKEGATVRLAAPQPTPSDTAP